MATSKTPNPRALVAVLLTLLGAAVVFDMTRVRMARIDDMPALPEPVTNNAVVAVVAGGREYLVSIAGLGEGKTHGDTHARTFVYDGADNAWREVDPLPGDVGRLAATAVAVGERAYIFGGYTVAADGSEVSTHWVHAFDPVSGVYEERRSMPVPVDDAVAVTWRDRYVYLVSGWHDFGNVNLVQRYDTVTDTWDQATPTPGRSVFGHAGGIVGNTIVYCDGVAVAPHRERRRDFAATAECYAGHIDEQQPRRIDWREIEPHPGLPRYRMAAAGTDDGVLFVGGSENPYNYDGIGYDGRASLPAPHAMLYDVDAGRWRTIKVPGAATMDHRGLVSFGDSWVTIGGMADGQRVVNTVNRYSFD